MSVTHIRVSLIGEEGYDVKKIKRNCIRKFREKAGLTQRALAKEVGTSQQQIQRLESGEQAVRNDLAMQICAVINAKLSEVFPETRKVIRKLRASSTIRAKISKAHPTHHANPLLADATDLETWATRLDAQALLPQLIRRLALSTLPAIDRIFFRSGEGTRLGGWDGVIQAAAGNAFVPTGISCWEMGTNADVKGKADDDYDKRTSNPLEMNPKECTYIQVTPRRWSSKEKWAIARQKQKIWKDVRVLDADDLSTWLEQALAVHVWLSIRIGKRPSGLIDLQGFWEMWSGVTQPALPHDLLTSGRASEVEELLKFLHGQPSVLGVQAETRNEAVAFIVSAISKMSEQEREQVLARGLVIEDLSSWRQILEAGTPLILIPTFAERATVAGATAAGHLIVVPLGPDEPASRGAIQLPRLKRDEAKKAFEAIGVSTERARSLSAIARRSMGALRRTLAISPAGLTPKWASPENARFLIPALLAGRWDDRNPGDQLILATLSGKDYGLFREILIRWANEHDPPIRQIGNTWLFASREDGWNLLSAYLSSNDLEKLLSVVLDVLGEYDPSLDLPEGERWQANLKGKTLSKSKLLREGLAQTLAIMGSLGETSQIEGLRTVNEWADYIVRELLDRAKGWHLWASLSPYLQLLAEAAPDTFLSSLHNSLVSQEGGLINLFADKENHIFGSSPHTGLLWALEVLAWSPEHLGASSLILAKLARLDPGGKLGNRPPASLRNIFLSWCPSTAANLEQRLRVLSQIRESEPEVAWNLLISLLPKGMDSGNPSAKPNWRDWMPEVRESVTYAEIFSGTAEMVKWLLQDVGTNSSRWRTLIGSVEHLRKIEFDAILDQLRTVLLTITTDSDRAQIRASLRHVISRHRQFPDAEWVLPEEAINRLEEVFSQSEPQDPLVKRAWLFTHHPDLPDMRSDWKKFEEAVLSARVKAVEDLMVIGGLPLILELANQVQTPGEVGYAFGRSSAFGGTEMQFLTQYLASTNSSTRQLVMRFLHGRASLKGEAWLTSVLLEKEWSFWSSSQKADYFLCLPWSEQKLWNALDAQEDDTKNLYWSQVEPYGRGSLTADIFERAAPEFLKHGRLATAVELLSIYSHSSESIIRPHLVVEVLQKLKNVGNNEKVNWASLSCNIGELLDLLTRSGQITDSELAQLEWFFLPLFRHRERQPKVLHRALAQQPELFMEMLKLMFRAEGEEPTDVPEDQQVRATLAYDLISGWKTPPGLNEDLTVPSDALHDWVRKVREIALGCGRITVADHKIGNLLSHYPPGSDGIWPHEVLRNLIEELANDEIEKGIKFGVINSRGVISRSLQEGGSQERAIAERYKNSARALADRWQRTARLLRNLGKMYESDARREDIETELREDLWS